MGSCRRPAPPPPPALPSAEHDDICTRLDAGEAVQHPGGNHDRAIGPLAEKDVFGGRVPQIKDWLAAWGDVTEKVSFRKLNLRKVGRK